MQLQSVLDLFHQVVEQHGTKPILRSSKQEVSYQDLEQRANRLAQFLLSKGGGQEQIVAILLDNRIELVTTVLATLKAACVFVPLDSQSPQMRLSTIVSEVEPQWIITEPKFLDAVQQLAAGCAFSIKVLCLPDEHKLSSGQYETLQLTREYLDFQETSRPLIPSLDPDGLCYIYFTSGSSGKPKGIAGRRKGLDHFIRWELKTVNAQPGMRVSQLTSPSFDPFLRDIFVPLCSGGVICIPDGRDTLLNPERLVQWIEAEHIHLIHCTPSLFRAIINANPRPDHFTALRYILLAGERLLPADVSRWCAIFGNRIQLVNLYGPTEVTLAKLFYFVQPQDGERRSIPIGKPMEGARVLIGNELGHACPNGTVGEIYIRTPYRSLGYYRQPELTAQVFIQNPFDDNTKDIVYKTGDYGRILPNGDVEYLGRRDQQVKIRGARVELGEIENALRFHPLVEDVAVIDREDNASSNYLCAYLVLKQKLDVDSLRNFLQQYLPDTMIPSTFVFMEALPRTLSGKVDRRALPDPEKVRPDLAAEYIGPRTPIEEMLVRIWSQVLNIGHIGIHDNFFSLGGHSLLATQVIARTRDLLQAEIPLQVFFEQPTIAALSAYIGATAVESVKRVAPPIRRVVHSGNPPLSFAQQRLWFLDQLEPGSPFYNLSSAVSLEGPLDYGALEQSLQEIVQRHEILRTLFPVQDGEPVQLIRETMPVTLLRENISMLAEAEQERYIVQKMHAEASIPFDLSTGPLLRVSLLCRAKDRHVLFFSMHHIISDGWSTAILVRELSALYTAHVAGQSAILPELPIQYTDFAIWQREWLRDQVLQEQMNYWREQLSDIPQVLDLPLDHPRPAIQSYQGAHRRYVLPQSLLEQIKSLSSKEDVTLFMTLLASLQALLARYSGQEELIVGSPIANRTQSELEGLIGFFVNTLALRTNLAGNPTFREILQRVRRTCLDAYAHQDLPFERLFELVEVERDLSHSPIFQVVLSLQNTPATHITSADLVLEPLEIESNISKFDLTFFCTETDEGLHCEVEYNTALFECDTIERLMGHWQVLLTSVVADPEQQLERLPLLTEAERHLQLVVWNDTAADYPDTCFQYFFEEQVERTPEAIAVICEERRLTYRELNRLTNRLAHQLVAAHVGPEVLVSLFADRDIELLVMILAVFKAGGAYLPLEPHDPPLRVCQMIERSQSPLILTTRSCQTLLEPVLTGISVERVPQVMVIEEALEHSRNEENLAIRNTPDHLAYVIYTSGSTGLPKGAMIEHRGMLCHLYGKIKAMNLSEQDCVAQTASQCFDISIWQYLVPLMLGGNTHIFKDEIAHDPLQLLRQLEKHRITIYETVPSLLQVMLTVTESEKAAERPRFEHLRWLIPTGEALPPELIRSWFALYPHVPLLNAYGATECSDDVTYYPIFEPLNPEVVQTPIGKPIDNMQQYVLDRHLQPVPIGVRGEVYFGGIAVGRGYLGDPERTAETFLRDPFRATPGARLYKTGDLARALPDGNVVFLGRIDHQVKVRGHRIELGEIEAALREQDTIRDTVVLVQEDATGDKQLVAYVVAEKEVETKALSQKLSLSLQEKLPNYMVPAVFIFLENIPLTTNGKVDRRALPRPDFSDFQQENPAAPTNAVEELLVNIWCDVLGRKNIDLHENFFEIGGHSLLATQVIARIRSALQIELPLRRLFETPTISELVEHIMLIDQEKQGLQRPPLVPAPRDTALPLSFAQQRLWFLTQLDSQNASYNVPSAILLEGEVHLPLLQRCLQEIVQRHELLRTTFTQINGVPMQIIAPELFLPLPIVDLASVDKEGTEVQRFIEEEALLPFNLDKEPPVRVKLLRLHARSAILLLTLHHIISDGWSMGVLARELMTLYTAFAQEKPSPLPDLSIQYADYAYWQRQWLRDDILEKQLGYWREQLAGVPPVLSLPTDHPRPARQTYRGAVYTFEVTSELTQALKDLSRAEDMTLFMTLLATFQVLLHRYCKSDDIVVGTDIANRTQLETEALIGFFVNLLVLRTNLSSTYTFRDVLRHVREVVFNAYGHQDVPFDKLVDDLHIERPLNHNPLVQVLFVLQNAPMPALELPGLSITPMQTPITTTKFDLALFMEETPEGLRGLLNYSTDLFEVSTIEKFAQHFTTLLASVVAAPTTWIEKLEMVSETEKAQQIKNGNAFTTSGLKRLKATRSKTIEVDNLVDRQLA